MIDNLHGPSIYIVYLTETGASQGLAEQLCDRLIRLNFRASVLNSADAELIAKLIFRADPSRRPIIVFFASTTGNGEIPTHARKLWRLLLRKKWTSQSLANILFTSFGLGDSTYTRFNWAARKLHTRIIQLGANEICTRGEADEVAEGGTESAYAAWEKVFCERLLELYPLPEGQQPIPDDTLLPPKIPVRILSLRTDKLRNEKDITTAPLEKKNLRVGSVVYNRRVTPRDHFQDVRQFKFKLDHEEEIVPGATALIYPQNHPSLVEVLLLSQKWDKFADNIISVPPSVEKWAYTRPLTLRNLITHHLDITSVPRASFFKALSYFSKGDEQQLEKLLEFSNASNEDFVQDRYNYADRPRRSSLECLVEFESVQIPVEYILEIFGQLRPRSFSIAGVQGNEVELLIAIVKYKTMLRRVRHGVCTRYLSSLTEDDKFIYEISAPAARCPPLDRPVVMVGPGTGVAPLKFLFDVRMKATNNGPMTVLFFGNRNRTADFFYEDIWKGYSSTITADPGRYILMKGESAEIYACFSRDNDSSIRYVQHMLEQDEISREIGHLLVHMGGYVWVCGSKGKMPKAVRSMIQAAIEKVAGENIGVKYISEMDKSGRYLEETW
ncbi:hypothetical protein V1511DRAFT_505345 [Dipodascopsis uninucleata]